MRRSKRTRTLAALKGWRTRRRHQRERAERAKKGWRTRRKLERVFQQKPGAVRKETEKIFRETREVAERREEELEEFEYAITHDYKGKGK